MKKWIAHLMDVDRFRPLTMFGVGLGLMILFYAVSGYILWDAHRDLQSSHKALTELRRLITTAEQTVNERMSLSCEVSGIQGNVRGRLQMAAAHADTALARGIPVAQLRHLTAEWNNVRAIHGQIKTIEAALHQTQADQADSIRRFLADHSYPSLLYTMHKTLWSTGLALTSQRTSIGDIFLNRIIGVGLFAGTFLLTMSIAWAIFVQNSIRHFRGRREAEDALRESEGKYRTLIEALPHAVIIVQDFNVIFANSAAGAMFGTSSLEPSVVRRMSDFIAERERERLEGFFLARLRGEAGVPEHYTTVLLRLDGEEFPADVYVRAILYHGRQAMQAAIYDITERQRAEEALRESEERFRNLADMAPVLIWMAGTKRHTYYFNRTWLNFTGRTVGQEYGQGWQEGVHPEDLPRLQSVYETAFASRNSFTIEYRLRHADNTYHWLLDTGVPRFSQERSFTGYIGSCIDITARKDAEQALRDSEERFRRVYNQTPVMMHSIDRNVQLVGVSDFWLETLGYERKDVLGRRMTDFLTPSSKRYVEDHVLPLFFREGRVTNEPYQFVKKNGEVIDTLLSTTCERDGEGNVMRSYSVIVDITERKRMEAEREAARQMLRIVLDNIPVRVFWKDTKSRYLGCNINFAHDAGLTSPEEIVGKDDFQLSWLAQAEQYRNDDREVMQSGIPKLQYEEPQTWLDGTHLWLNTSKIPLRDTQSRVIGVLGTYEDITARKNAEEALRRSEEKFLRAFRTTSVLMAISTVKDGRFVEVNDTFLQTLGYTREEVIGKTSQELNLFVDIHQRRQVVKLMKETGNARDVDVLIRTRSGDIRDGLFSADILELQDGMYLLTSMNDITERKRVEEALHKRLEFENLISTISTHFIHLTYHQIDAAIDQALAAIGQYAEADRSYVFQFRADGNTMDNTHEWCADGISSESYRMQNIAADDALPYFTPFMRRLEVFHIPRVRELPPEAAAEKSEFDAQNIQSLICLPMHLHGQLLGFLGFDSVRKELAWSDDVIALLRLVGEIFVNALDRKRSDEALHRQAEIMDQIHDAVITTDLNGRVLSWNKGAERIYGYAAEDILGQDIGFLYSDAETLRKDVIEPLQAKGRYDTELRLQRKNGEEFDAHLALTMLYDRDGAPYGMTGYSIDITERKRAERELQRMNRALRAISECNQALVRATNEAELLNDICRIIVNFGGYRFAWVGYAENDERKTVRPAAQAGAGNGYLEQIQITWAEDSRGMDPTGKAIRSGQPCTVRYVEEDPNYTTRHKEALEREFRSSAAVPLRIGQQSIGALNVYAAESNAFDKAETELLVELADDLAFGISALRTRAEHERTVANLAESEERYRTLFETMGQGVVYQDHDGHIVNANRAAERIMGLTLEQMRGRTSADRRWRAIRPDGTPFPGETHPSMVALLTGLPVRDIVMGVYNQNEERYRWIEVDAVPQFIAGESTPHRVYTIFSDITERKEAEEALRQSEERFRLAFHTSPDAVNINRLSDGIYVDVNEGFTQTTGFSLEDVAGKSSLEINIWDNPADRIRLISGLRDVGVVRNLEAKFRMKDGRVRSGLMSARVILLNNEPHILSITRDIDELKKAEEAVRQSEERYRNFIRNATEGIYRIDFIPPVPIDLPEPELIAQLAKNAIVGEVNDHLARMYGLTPAELAGRPATDFAPDYGERALLAVRAPNYQVEAQETRDVDASGQTIYLIENFTGLVEDGHLIHIWGMQSNITARKRAEEERRRAEDALKISEERFSKAFSASPMAIAVTRMSDGTILECNEAAESYFEYGPGEVIGLTTKDLGLWSRIEDREQILRDLAERIKVRDREYQFVTRSGKAVVARYSAEPIELGNEPCLLSVFVDITERKRAENAIRESEARYRLLADNVSDIISRHDAALNYLYVSPAVRMLGYEPEELIGATAAKLIHPDDLKYISANIDIMLHEKKDVTVEYRFRRKDGIYIWIESSARPIIGQDGSVSEFIVVGRDISKRKQAEDELRDQRWRLGSIIEGTRVGTWEWNVQTGETIFNETWARMLGYTLEELSPLDVTVWERLTHPDDLKKAYEELQRHFTGELPYYDCEMRMKHHDGHWVWIHDRGRVITFTSDGKPLLMFGTHTDITERKQAEEALLLNESRLEAMVQLNQMKSESLEEIAIFTMEEAVRLTQSTIGYVAFANDDETELTMYAWSRTAMQECLIQNKPLVYKVSETGLWGEAVRQRQAVITNDYAAPCPWKKGYPDGHVHVARHMNVPIFDDGKIVIVAGVGNKTAEYDESDVRQLRLLMEGMWRIVQRKKAEDALQQKTDELDRFFNVTLDLLAIADTDGNFRRMNREWERTLGYSLRELEGHRFLDFVHPDDLDSTLAAVSELSAGHDVLNFTNRYRCKDGTYRWIEWRSTAYQNKLIYAAARDVTESRRIQSALREANQRRQALFEEARDAIIVADAESGEIIEVNRMAETLLERARDELIGMHQSELHPVDHRDANHQTFRDTTQAGGHEAVEREILTKSGKRVPVEIKASLVELAGGRKVMQGFFRDITERKEAEQELLKRQARLDSIFRAAPSGMGILCDRKVVEANETTCRMIGYTREEVIGRDTSFLYLSDEAYEQAGRDIYSQLKATGEATVELVYKRKNGTHFNVLARLAPVELPEWPGAVTFVITDITELRQAEQATRESEERYRNFIFNASEGIYRIDLVPPVDITLPRAELEKEIAQNAIIGEVNTALAAMYGLTSEVMVGRLVTDFAPNCGTQMADLLQEENYQISEREEAEFAETGEPIHIRESYTGMVEDGKLHRVWGVQANITERKRAEEAARRESELVARIMETSPVGITVVDSKGKITFANPRAEGILGLAKTEILQRQYNDPAWHIADINGQPIPDDELPFRIIHRTGKTIEDMRHSIVWPDGRIIRLSINASPQYDEKGEFSGMVAALTDITERLRADQALRDSERRLHSVIQGSPIPTFVIDKDHKVLEWNKALAELSGIRAEDVIGTPDHWRAFYHDPRPCMADLLVDEKLTDVSKWYADKYEKSKLIDDAFEATDEFPDLHGESRWLTFTAAGIRDADGNLVGAIETLQDITERKRAEDALRERQARIESLWKGAPVGIGVTYNRVLNEVNDRLCQIVGYSRDELIGQDTRMLYLSEEDWSDIATTVYPQVIAHGTANKEVRWRRKDGQIVDLILSITTILPGQTDTGMLFTALDITDRKRAEEARAVSQRFSEALIEGMPGIFYLYDHHLRLRRWNRNHESELGYTKEELEGKDIATWHTSEEARRRAVEGIDTIMSNGGTTFFEGNLLHRNGCEVPYLLSATRIDTPEGPMMFGFGVNITDRKKAEVKLRESEQRLRSIIDEAPFGAHLYELDAENQLVFIGANAAADRILGIDHSQRIGRFIDEAFPGLAGTDVPETYRQVARTGERKHFDQIVYDRGEINGAFEVHAFATGAGRMAAFFEDVTERKRAEEALRASETRLRMITDNMADAITQVDERGNVVYVSPSLTRIFGWTQKETTEFSLEQFVHPDDRDYMEKTFYSAIAEHKTSVRMEYRARKRDGQYAWIESTVQNMYGDQGEFAGAIIGTRDVTERKRAEEALRASETRLRMITDNMADTICHVDVQRVVTYVSPSVERVFGWTPEEVIGHSLLEFVHQDDVEEALKNMWAAIAEQRSVLTLEYRNQKRDGSYVWVESTVRILYTGQDDYDGAIISTREITERKQAEEALSDREARLMSIFLAAPIAIALMIDRKIVEANDKITAITGYGLDEIVGQNARILYATQEEYDKIGVELYPLIEEHGFGTVETRFERKDGSVIDILLSGSAIVPGRLDVGITFTAMDITERKKAEEALRDRQARLTSIFRAAPVGIGVVVDRVLMEINDTISTMTGYSAEELIGQSARMLYPTQEEFDFVGKEKYRQISQYGVGTVETHWVKKDGSVVDVLLSSSPIVPDDWSAGVTFTALDITERKRAAEALAESEQRFRMMAENAHDIIWTTDAELRLTYVSPAISGILGLKEENVLGQPIIASVAPESMDASLRFLQELIGDSETGGPEIGGVSHIEHEVMAANGSRVWMEVVATALRDGSGKVVGIQGISRDVTERKQAEDVVRRERDRAQMYLDLADVIMVALNNGGEITLMNKTGCRILGYEESELLGSDWFETALPESAKQATKATFNLLMKGEIEPVRYYENPVITKSGEERMIEWHNALIYDEFGHIMGTLSSGADITVRKRAEEELAARATELERSNAELERFAYVASHDLQEPLRMMASYAQLLDQRYRGRLDSDADDFIGFITSGADRMRQLIHDLLTFSRVDTRGKPFGPVDCEKVLQDVLHNLQVAVDESRVAITHDPLPTISADDTQMTQLFQNLISNAIKFRRSESPQVHISATDDEHHWEFAVQDNGMGIESKYFERIFIIFQRLHGQKDHPGTGIGLAICRKIIERHGGRIWVESKPGQGSTFHFTLPKRTIPLRRTGSHGSTDNR